MLYWDAEPVRCRRQRVGHNWTSNDEQRDQDKRFAGGGRRRQGHRSSQQRSAEDAHLASGVEARVNIRQADQAQHAEDRERRPYQDQDEDQKLDDDGHVVQNMRWSAKYLAKASVPMKLSAARPSATST